MEWATVISILIPVTAFFGFLYREQKEWRKESREDTIRISNDIRNEIKEIRAEIKEIHAENQEQAKRSDRLYEMFIDLLKAQNPKSNP